MTTKRLKLGLLAVFGLLALLAFATHDFGGAAGALMCAAAPIAITEEQFNEFKSVLEGLKGYRDMFPSLKDLGQAEGGFAALKKLPETFKELADGYKLIDADLKKIKKQMLSREGGGNGVRWVGNVPFVSDDCARALSAMYVMRCGQTGQWPTGLRSEESQQRALGMAREALGMEQRAALSGSDIMLPTVYVPQIVELVWKYGQIRQYGTVFPLGAGTVKLPRLKAGEDAFAYLGVGTAGMSQTVGEKKVAQEEVTFTANKFGGIVRIPTEIEEDAYVPLGQFIARYVARRFAFGEDDTAFNGDGTSTYANISGISKYATSNTAYLLQLASGKTKPSDATLADFRNLRPKINAAAYQGAAYYMHVTMDALLVTFNTLNQPLIYVRNANGATLDGFPIRWTGVHQPYTTAAAAAKHLATFGDLSYAYLGERGQPRVETSREVYFATDEIGMRALERIDFELMAIDAVSAMLTAAS